MKLRLLFSLVLGLVLAVACTAAPAASPALPEPAAPDLLAVSAEPDRAQPEAEASVLTARQLIAPHALAGPGPNSFTWSPLGAALTYVQTQDDQTWLWLYDAATGEKRALLDAAAAPDAIDLTSSQWAPGGDALLLTGQTALWLLDLQTNELQPLAEGDRPKTSVSFTPDGTRVSFVQDNNLYLLTIADGAVQPLTTDGGETVFNGALDWVYTEELATRAAQPAYAWSPDGVWLLYLRLDETAVHQDPVTDFRPIPATVSYTRYPTVGTANPEATLHALTPEALAPPLALPMPEDSEYVLPFFTWTPDSNHVLYITVNRDHTTLTLNRWTPQSGETRALITEVADDWINEDRYAAPVFLDDGQRFLWLSERDGFMHLYLYDKDGALLQQLTQGEWMIDSSGFNLLTPGRPVHVDPTGTWAYFISTRNSPLERQIERVNLADGTLKQVTQQPGFHLAALSSDGGYLIDQVSDVNTPPITRIAPTDGGEAAVLAEVAGPALDLPQLSREFVTLQAHDGTDLYAQLVKPQDFDPSRQYPVIVHWYGGPTLQMVSNRYGTTNIFNHIERDVLYTQAGFLVWRLDNRGTLGRGHAFEAPIFGELGKAALDDQLAGIEYLKTLPYVDPARIGADGKSFGGYLTLYALLHAPEVFRCGVAGAAPTDWTTYDTIYTERYMRTPAVNPEGYAATNLVAKADEIQARPLLIHGLADTNVHLQNTVNFIQALQAADKLFNFVPLPNLSHSFRGDGLAAALSASVDYLASCLGGQPPAAASAADPLPSWNAGATRDAILQFVADVTDPASPAYVPPAERIAVFDNDGTLWTEKPLLPQAAFLFQRVVELAPEHPEWQTTQPYQAILEQDFATLQTLSAAQIEELLFATHAGMTVEEFNAQVQAFLAAATHPRFGVPYTQTVYQPMLELLAYLRAHGFKTFIVSGGGVDFMRAFAEDVYGIPPEQVIGSSLQYQFQQTPAGSALVRQPELVTFDDKAQKPVNIQRAIGRRPILAAGNSDGDLQMLQYTASGGGPFLNLLVVHDDAEREYAYQSGAEEVTAAAAQNSWLAASVQQDFKTVFP